VEHYEGLIQALGNSANIKTEASYGARHSLNELVNLAKSFALLTRASLNNVKLQKSVAQFQALVLLSYCVVLREMDVPHETIDGIIRYIHDSERERKSLLKGALWINRLINNLADNSGWTIYRATELFFLGMLSKLLTSETKIMSLSASPPLAYLRRIYHGSNAQTILKHLKAEEFVGHDYSDCLRTEYTIPGLIGSLLRAYNVSIDKLSYEFPSVETARG
jgi:hypothetical protein